MHFVELLGWLAAAFTLAAWSMRTMLPLRTIAVLANIFFVAYGALAEVYPALALHLVLLPLNLFRLVQLLILNRKVQAAKDEEEAIALLRPLMKPSNFSDGSYIFRKGDTADNLYFLSHGNVHLEEIDTWLSDGEVFGEMAFFSDTGERTTSARCHGICEIVQIDEATLMRLYYQHPPLAFFLIKLVTRRLLDGMRKCPEAYLPNVPIHQKKHSDAADNPTNCGDIH